MQTTTMSRPATLISPQQLGAHTRRAHAHGKQKPGWVAQVQEERATRKKLHAQRLAELEEQGDAIEAMAKRIQNDRARAIAKEANRKTASGPTPSAPTKPSTYPSRVRRTPDQQRAFDLLLMKSGRRPR